MQNVDIATPVPKLSTDDKNDELPYKREHDVLPATHSSEGDRSREAPRSPSRHPMSISLPGV